MLEVHFSKMRSSLVHGTLGAWRRVSGWGLRVSEPTQGGRGGGRRSSGGLLPAPHNSTRSQNPHRELCGVRRREDEEGGRPRSHDGTARLPHATHDLKPNAAAAGGFSDATEELADSEASRMFFSDGTLSAVGSALLVGVTWLSVLRDLAEGSSDFSGRSLLCRVRALLTEEAV